jgi:hypothetical protein
MITTWKTNWKKSWSPIPNQLNVKGTNEKIFSSSNVQRKDPSTKPRLTCQISNSSHEPY